jgi:hypothetical protein
MPQMVGGCLCGNIRYLAEAEPAVTAVCHCKNCQRQAGSAYSVIVGVPRSALTIQGTLKTFTDTADSVWPVYRSFCPDCGSPITTSTDAMPRLVFIKAGTLDDTSWLEPTMQLWCDSAQPWAALPDGMQCHPRMPELPDLVEMDSF